MAGPHHRPARSRPHPDAPLIDGFGRVVRDLRVSVTDRCNFRCTYCMPAGGLPWLPQDQVLSFEEIARVVSVLRTMGLRTVRITGGEPLLRRDLDRLVAQLAAVGVEDLALTTNGVLLGRSAAALADAGLDRVNVSLDSLDRATFARIARRDALDEVLDGLRAAADAGLAPIKVNVTVIRGVNDHEVVDLAAMARDTGHEVRFIEFMPLDGDRAWRRDLVVDADEVLAGVHAAFPLLPAGDDDGPATVHHFADGAPGAVGVVPSVTRPFCDTCDRIRLTADGALRTCLFAAQETDLRAVLRGGGSDAHLAAAVRSAVDGKPAGHRIGAAGFAPPGRTMSRIGG